MRRNSGGGNETTDLRRSRLYHKRRQIHFKCTSNSNSNSNSNSVPFKMHEDRICKRRQEHAGHGALERRVSSGSPTLVFLQGSIKTLYAKTRDMENILVEGILAGELELAYFSSINTINLENSIAYLNLNLNLNLKPSSFVL